MNCPVSSGTPQEVAQFGITDIQDVMATRQKRKRTGVTDPEESGQQAIRAKCAAGLKRILTVRARKQISEDGNQPLVSRVRRPGEIKTAPPAKAPRPTPEQCVAIDSLVASLPALLAKTRAISPVVSPPTVSTTTTQDVLACIASTEDAERCRDDLYCNEDCGVVTPHYTSAVFEGSVVPMSPSKMSEATNWHAIHAGEFAEIDPLYVRMDTLKEYQLKEGKTLTIGLPEGVSIYDPQQISEETYLSCGTYGQVSKVCIKGYTFAKKSPRHNTPLCILELVKEANIMSYIPRHPHIVGLCAINLSPSGELSLLLDMMDTDTLRHFVCKQRGEQPLFDCTILKYLREIAAALVVVHGCKLIHGDIKPNNILINRGSTYLGDFGASIQFASRRHNGAPMFRSPEADGKTPLTGAVDIWALGVVALELVSASAVDRRMDMLSSHDVHLLDPDILRYDLTGVSADIAQIITSCLQAEPEKRPTADQLVSMCKESLETDYLLD